MLNCNILPEGPAELVGATQPGTAHDLTNFPTCNSYGYFFCCVRISISNLSNFLLFDMLMHSSVQQMSKLIFSKYSCWTVEDLLSFHTTSNTSFKR